MEKLAKNLTLCFLLSWKDGLQFLLSKSLDTCILLMHIIFLFSREREKELEGGRGEIDRG